MSNNDWQKAIREAQNKKIAAVLAARKEAEQERAKEQRELGKQLAKVLAFFGIEVDAPERNLVTLGEYEFSLQEKTNRDRDSGYVTAWAYEEFNGYRMEDDKTADRVRFTLYVAPKGWHDADELDWITNVNQKNLTSEFNEIDGDWTTAQAKLADSLDALSYRVDLERKAYERRQTEAKPETTISPDDPVGPAPLTRNGLDVLANRLEGDNSHASTAEMATALALLDIAYSLRRLVNQGDLNFAFGSAAGIDVDRLFDPLD